MHESNSTRERSVHVVKCWVEQDLFCAETVTYACNLINRLPSNALDDETPIEVWSGKPVTYYRSLSPWFRCLLSCKEI